MRVVASVACFFFTGAIRIGLNTASEPSEDATLKAKMKAIDQVLRLYNTLKDTARTVDFLKEEEKDTKI